MAFGYRPKNSGLDRRATRRAKAACAAMRGLVQPRLRAHLGATAMLELSDTEIPNIVLEQG